MPARLMLPPMHAVSALLKTLPQSGIGARVARNTWHPESGKFWEITAVRPKKVSSCAPSPQPCRGMRLHAKAGESLMRLPFPLIPLQNSTSEEHVEAYGFLHWHGGSAWRNAACSPTPRGRPLKPPAQDAKRPPTLILCSPLLPPAPSLPDLPSPNRQQDARGSQAHRVRLEVWVVPAGGICTESSSASGGEQRQSCTLKSRQRHCQGRMTDSLNLPA